MAKQPAPKTNKKLKVAAALQTGARAGLYIGGGFLAARAGEGLVGRFFPSLESVTARRLVGGLVIGMAAVLGLGAVMKSSRGKLLAGAPLIVGGVLVSALAPMATGIVAFVDQQVAKLTGGFVAPAQLAAGAGTAAPGGVYDPMGVDLGVGGYVGAMPGGGIDYVGGYGQGGYVG